MGQEDVVVRMSAPEPPPLGVEGESIWCVVANVLIDRPHGMEKEIRHGTKHFAPGAKVFIYDFFWGQGGEQVKVIGRQRRSKKFIRLVMPAKHLANWRAEAVYHPYVINVIRGETQSNAWNQQTVKEIAAGYMARGANSQPFITRPPMKPER